MSDYSESAFPVAASDYMKYVPGLTKRELFAAMALQGILANYGRMGSREQYAQEAVMHADLLIAELAKEGGAV